MLIFLIGVVSGATTRGSLDVGVDGGNIIISPGGCQPNWECVLTECIDNQQIWMCYDNNQCGGSYPIKHGQMQSCETSNENGDSGNGGNGGGGGGGSGVSGGSVRGPYDWNCTAWSECRDGKQIRTCNDLYKNFAEISEMRECVDDFVPLSSVGGIGEINETGKVGSERLSIAPITGAVVGFVKENPTRSVALLLGLMVFGFWIVVTKKKK